MQIPKRIFRKPHHTMLAYGGASENLIVGEFLIEGVGQSMLLMSKSGERSLLKLPA